MICTPIDHEHCNPQVSTHPSDFPGTLGAMAPGACPPLAGRLLHATQSTHFLASLALATSTLGQELSLSGTFGLELAKLSLLSCFRHLWVNRWAFARSSACSDLHSVIVSPPYCEAESNSRVCFKISSVWLCVPQRHVFDLAYDMISWLNG